MQMSLTFARDARFYQVLDRLSAAWPSQEQGNSDPLSQLVFMVLSAQTPSALALAAFRRLRARFSRWSDLRDAAPDLLLATLRGVTQAPEKATTLPRLLQAIEDRQGLIELDFLAGWTNEAARQWLEELPGVNATISAATLNFSSLRKTVMTLDGESARVARRFGFVPAGAPMSALDRMIMDRMPPEWKAGELARLYRGMKKLSENLCHQDKPACKVCPLSDLCPSANRQAATILAFPSKARKPLPKKESPYHSVTQ